MMTVVFNGKVYPMRKVVINGKVYYTILEKPYCKK